MNWTADFDALAGVNISEVDMRDAGMTVIRSEGLLPQAEIDFLERLPKAERSIAVGRLSGERSRAGGRSLSEEITRGIRLRVESMLEANEIGTDSLLSVKRDAVFVMGRPPTRLVLEDGTVFRVKGTYTAYARLGRVELYCVPRWKRWDAKGISEEKRGLHGDFTVQLAMDFLGLWQGGDPREAAATLQQFRGDYVARRLPIGFYREFNSESSFCLQAGRSRFLSDSLGEGFPKESLDVAYNLRNVIIPLARALA